MRPIRSIIIFNSATAGDFLTLLCCSQLMDTLPLHKQQDTGRLLIDSNFKSITNKFYYNPPNKIKFDFDKVFPVDNSHYWLDCYPDIADRCVYINYPVEIQEGILDIYLEKVFDNDIQKMIDLNLPNQIEYIASKMNQTNARRIINTHWLKNIKNWAGNHQLTAIELGDFFVRSNLENIVQFLINEKISNRELFDKLYTNWIKNNSKLRSLFQ